jgi:hypothetical protein
LSLIILGNYEHRISFEKLPLGKRNLCPGREWTLVHVPGRKRTALGKLLFGERL